MATDFAYLDHDLRAGEGEISFSAGFFFGEPEPAEQIVPKKKVEKEVSK